jgi:putative ABC transport system permease protein
MSKIFFKTLFRNLWKNKTYSFLNIFGLAIGIACASLIFLWVEDEVSFDQSNAKYHHLYNILENQAYDGSIRTYHSTPGLMGPAVKAEIPGVANTCRMDFAQSLFKLSDKAIYEPGIFADPSLFSMFSIRFVQGSAQTAFKDLNEVVISQKMARQFFGDESKAVGKTLKADNKQNYIVAGVIEDIPVNSTIRFEWAAPFEVKYKQSPWMHSWGNNSINTYVELHPGANVDAVNKQLYGFIQKRVPEAIPRPFLHPMKDWRLRSNFEEGKQSGGRIQYVRMFTFIAWIILLIACINFMNLSTARSEKRAKEVGVRKVLGAARHQLTLQFIGEALIMSVLAVATGLVIVSATLPAFNLLVEKQLTTGLTNPLHWLVLVAITLLCGLVAGSYPSLYLSSFNPIKVFKGLNIKNGNTEWIRKGLAVLQFTVSIVLIISTIIIYQQIQHVKNRQIGYEKDNLLSIGVHGNMIQNVEAIKQDLMNTGLVENAGLINHNPLYDGNNGSGLRWQGKDDSRDIIISYRHISKGLIPTLGLKLNEGRDFNSNAKTDSLNVIITKSMAGLMGKGSAIGKTLQSEGDLPNTILTFTVVGVVNDFIYGDMYSTSDPVVFFCNPPEAQYLFIRHKPGADVASLLTKTEAIAKKYDTDYPFEYKFVDEQFNERFKSEMLVGKLSGVFASLAIIISCLGLFGLATYTAERRTKEIGIRKVLGATVGSITGLLSKDFMQLIFVAAIIAFPIAWWSMHSWLQSYAYRITINWWVFIVATVLAVAIALFTISFQAIKAALVNPVKSLRGE